MAKLPTWWSTLTLRALVIGALLGGCFCIISLKLSLTTGGEWAGGGRSCRRGKQAFKRGTAVSLAWGGWLCSMDAAGGARSPQPSVSPPQPAVIPPASPSPPACSLFPPFPEPQRHEPHCSPLPFNPYAVIPSLNIAAGLLGFFLLKSLAKGLDWAKAPIKFNPPLTAQEVTVIQVRMGAFVCLFTWPVSDSTGQQGTCNTPPQLRRRVKPRAGMLL